MPEFPDVDAHLPRLIRDDVLTGVDGLVVDITFPLDGINAAPGGVLVVARATPGGYDLNRQMALEPFTVDVWAESRALAKDVSSRIHSWLTKRGTRRLGDDGFLASAACTLRPARADSGDPNDRLVRYLATYDLTLRAAPTA